MGLHGLLQGELYHSYLGYTITNIKCSRIRTLNYKRRKGTQMKFYKAMAVSTLTKLGPQKTESADTEFFRSVAGYTRKDQTRHTKIWEELTIFNYKL
jgi:hypothetical protein